MRIHINPVCNLGDFLNSIPVLSGIAKAHGPVDLLLRASMRQFRGLPELLMHQGMFSSVSFDDERDPSQYLTVHSITREDQGSPSRPIETCRFENFVRDSYGLEFEVDDSFRLKVPDLGIAVPAGVHAGDRWARSAVTDGRRKALVLEHLPIPNFIDFGRDMLENAYIISRAQPPFISTFTGVSNIADLLGVEHIVAWEDSMSNWDGRPIEYSFRKHYYADRSGRLMHVNEVEEMLRCAT